VSNQNGEHKKSGVTQGMYILNEYWKPIAFITVLFWGIMAAAWPTIKVKADIGSYSDIVELKSMVNTLTQAVSINRANNEAATKNSALTLVIVAELTGRITQAESRVYSLQIADGKFNQAELLQKVLSYKETP
jgi:hypothetical protein